MKQEKEFQILYKHPSFNGLIQYIILYIITIILITILPIILTPTMSAGSYSTYLIATLNFISVFFIAYMYFHGYWHDVTKFYLKHIPEKLNFSENCEYAGVLIADKNLRFYKYFHIYNSGVLLLIEHLRNRGIPIKIVKKADLQDLRYLVYDKKCTELYIFGHGRRYGLKIHKNELIPYATMADAPKKKRIEQLHCNHKHKKGKSLAELLGAEERFKTQKMRTIEEVINCCLYEYFSV